MNIEELFAICQQNGRRQGKNSLGGNGTQESQHNSGNLSDGEHTASFRCETGAWSHYMAFLRKKHRIIEIYGHFPQ